MEVRIRVRVFFGGSHVFCVVCLPVELLELFLECTEEYFEIGDVRDRAFFRVLKQLDLAQDVLWGIIERGCSHQYDSFAPADLRDFFVGDV